MKQIYSGNISDFLNDYDMDEEVNFQKNIRSKPRNDTFSKVDAKRDKKTKRISTRLEFDY